MPTLTKVTKMTTLEEQEFQFDKEENFSGLVKRGSISLSSRRKAHIGTQIQTAVAQSY